MRKLYQNIKLAVDVVIFTVKEGKLNVLLIQMKKKPFYKWWSFPGGLIKKNEVLDQAARRILCEKTGVNDVYLEQLYTFGELDRDPFGRVVSTSYFALVPEVPKKLYTTEKYLDVKFWPVDLLPPLAYDHDEIAKYALTRLRNKLGYSNIVWSLLPHEFTLHTLQSVYEAILGHKLDKRNFRKKILELGVVKLVGKKTDGRAHRPAELYRFKTRKTVMMKVL